MLVNKETNEDLNKRPHWCSATLILDPELLPSLVEEYRHLNVYPSGLVGGCVALHPQSYFPALTASAVFFPLTDATPSRWCEQRLQFRRWRSDQCLCVPPQRACSHLWFAVQLATRL